MKRDNWPVGDFAIRPITQLQGKDECTYCQMPRGTEHRPECVLRDRTVVIRMAFEYVINVPEHWTPEMVERTRDEGRWCATNALDELQALVDQGNCLCGCSKTTYIREATEEDEADFQIFVADSKS